MCIGLKGHRNRSHSKRSAPNDSLKLGKPQQHTRCREYSLYIVTQTTLSGPACKAGAPIYKPMTPTEAHTDAPITNSSSRAVQHTEYQQDSTNQQYQVEIRTLATTAVQEPNIQAETFQTPSTPPRPNLHRYCESPTRDHIAADDTAPNDVRQDAVDVTQETISRRRVPPEQLRGAAKVAYLPPCRLGTESSPMRSR